MFLDRLGVSRQIILQVHELRHDESPCSEQDAQNDEQEEQNGYCRGKWFREPAVQNLEKGSIIRKTRKDKTPEPQFGTAC